MISLLPLVELSDIFPSSEISVVNKSLSFDSFNDDGIRSGGGKLRDDGVTSPLSIVGWIEFDFGVWLRLFECDWDRCDNGESDSSIKFSKKTNFLN